MNNTIAERSIRGMGIGRRNFLFFGSDSGGERAAIIYGLIDSCKLNNIVPQTYLQYVLERIADHPINRIADLLPWNLFPANPRVTRPHDTATTSKQSCPQFPNRGHNPE